MITSIVVELWAPTALTVFFGPLCRRIIFAMLLLTKGIIHLRLGSFCQLSRPCAVDGTPWIDGWDKRSTTNDTSGCFVVEQNSFEKYARLNWIILPGTLNVIHNVPRKRSLSLSQVVCLLQLNGKGENPPTNPAQDVHKNKCSCYNYNASFTCCTVTNHK